MTSLKEYLSIIFRYRRKRVLVLLALMLLATALEGIGFALFLPLVQLVAGTVGVGASAAADPVAKFVMGFSLSLSVTLGFIVVVFAAKNIILYFQKYYAADLSLQFDKRIKNDMIAAIFAARWPHLLKQDSGKLMNAVTTQSRFAAESFRILSLLSLEVLTIIAYCILGLWISWKSFLLSAVVGGISYLILREFVGRSRVIGGESVEIRNRVASEWMTDLGALKFIKGNHLEEHRQKTSERLLERLYKKDLQGEKYSAVMDTLPDFLAAVVIAILLYSAFYLVKIPGERLIVVVMVLYRMNRRLMTMQSLKQRLFLYLPSYDLCRNIEEECRREAEKTAAEKPIAMEADIRFENISFSYDAIIPVLSDLSVTIKKNEFVAFIGRSGSGKTTALDLVLGLLSPDRGSVLIDGKPLQPQNLFSWRNQISYVPQDPVIVPGTIAKNIKMEKRDATMEEIRRAAVLAHAEEFIVKRPEGYETVVGDRGIQLSGGQRQRIALARALMREPQLLILDEATSALDQESERMIQQALEGLAGKLTIIVVAHRLSTIEGADRVFLLENGSVADEGSLSQLKSRSASFQKLYGNIA